MIHIITTGGTIGGADLDLTEEATKIVDISDIIQRMNVSFDYRVDPVFYKDSRAITKEDRELLAEKIQTSIFNKILVTHGTYTMEDTAMYLGNLKINKTIILVGSLVLGSDNNSDILFNLGYAIANLQLLKKGVYIAMNGQVFNWYNVYKNLTENKFKTLNP